MIKVLTLEEVAAARDIPKKRLREHWGELVDDGLAILEKGPTGKHLKYTADIHLDAIYTKIFWCMYEGQKEGHSMPPVLRSGVATRLIDELKYKDHTLETIADYGDVADHILRAWYKGGCATVYTFERFLMRYRDEDVFNHINITQDIALMHESAIKQRSAI